MTRSSHVSARTVLSRAWRRLPTGIRALLAAAGTGVAYVALVSVVGWAASAVEGFELAVGLIAVATLLFAALLGRWPVAALPAALTVMAFVIERAADPSGQHCGEDGCGIDRLTTLVWFTLPATVMMLLGVAAGKAMRVRRAARHGPPRPAARDGRGSR